MTRDEARALVAPWLDRFLDELVADCGDDPDATVGVVGIAVEVASGTGTSFQYLCSDERRWVQRAFFENVAEVADELSWQTEDD